MMPQRTEGLRTDIVLNSFQNLLRLCTLQSSFSINQETFKSLNILISLDTLGLIFQYKFHFEKLKKNPILDIAFTIFNFRSNEHDFTSPLSLCRMLCLG